MEQRAFRGTGLTVSVLGLGAGQLGEAWIDDATAARVLHAALDAGVRLIDTARGYGRSEERIGRHLGARRAGVVVVTKVGYDVDDAEDWTAAAVTGGIERALRVMRADTLDVALLHSCSLETLKRGDVICMRPATPARCAWPATAERTRRWTGRALRALRGHRDVGQSRRPVVADAPTADGGRPRCHR